MPQRKVKDKAKQDSPHSLISIKPNYTEELLSFFTDPEMYHILPLEPDNDRIKKLMSDPKYDAKDLTNSCIGNCPFADIINNVDYEKFRDLLYSGNLDFFEIYINQKDGKKTIFEFFKPFNYPIIFDVKIDPKVIDFDYIEKKFNMLIELYEYYFKYKSIAEVEFAFINSELDADRAERDEYKKFIRDLTRNHQENFMQMLDLYTRNLAELIQGGIYLIELGRKSLSEQLTEEQKMIELIRIEHDPKNKLSPTTIYNLQRLQLKFTERSEYLFTSKAKILFEDVRIYEASDEEFVKTCKLRIENLDIRLQLIFGINSEHQIYYSVLSKSINSCEKSNAYGVYLRKSIATLSENAHRLKQPQFFDLKKNCPYMVCYGFTKFFRKIPKENKNILKNLLLSDDERIFKTENFKIVLRDELREFEGPKEFEEFIKAVYYRLNITPIIIGSAIYFNKNPESEFPIGIRKNLWNLVLFNRDIEAIENFPLDLIACHRYKTSDSAKSSSHREYKENSIKVFLDGQYNNLLCEKRTIDCLNKLISYGFSVQENLSEGEKIELLINRDGFSEYLWQDLQKNILIISDLESDLLDFAESKSSASSAKDERLMNKLLAMATAYEKHIGENEDNIEKSIQKSSDTELSAENILNFTGFLNHLNRAGVILKLSKNSDKLSQNLMKRIDGLIDKLDDNNQILFEKKERDSQKLIEEFLKEEAIKTPKIEKGKSKKSIEASPKSHQSLPNALSELTKTPQILPSVLAPTQEPSPNSPDLSAQTTKEDSKKSQAKIDNERRRIERKKQIDTENARKTKLETIEATKIAFTKLDKFFDFLREQKWLGISEIGLYGSRVYLKILKKTKPELDIKIQGTSDYDFFCVSKSDQIFVNMPDRLSSQINFQKILDDFNKANKDIQISFAYDGDKSVLNYQKQKKSLNLKLKAKIRKEEVEFDLNFYSPSTVKEMMQWQYQFERVTLIQLSDKTFHLKINRHGEDSEKSLDFIEFIKKAQNKEESEFLFNPNPNAKGFLYRIFHQKGIFKYIDEESTNKFKKKLMEDEEAKARILTEYLEYVELCRIDSKDPRRLKKKEDAEFMIQKINNDPIFKDLVGVELSEPSIHPRPKLTTSPASEKENGQAV